MRAEHIWPNGLRYLWTDAFGVVLLVSLYSALAKDEFLDEAEWVVAEVDRVLGRRRGVRIGEEPDRDGQYFHYLAMWLYALAVIGRHIPRYREKGVDLVHQVHDAFLVPGRGVIWKMKEDLSGPYPGFGLGALDAFDGYVSYRMLDEKALSREIADMRKLIDQSAPRSRDYAGSGSWHDVVDDPLLSGGRLGAASKGNAVSPCSIICGDKRVISVGSQIFPAPNSPSPTTAFPLACRPSRQCQSASIGSMSFFDSYRSGDEYDRAAITHVMACSSHFPGYLMRYYI